MDSDMKGSRDFYELCYDQYKIELEEAEKLYQKVSIVMILIPVLGSVSYKLGCTELLDQEGFPIIPAIYYLSIIAVWGFLAVSIVFSILCVIPRNYKRIGDMTGWHDWLLKYQKYIEDLGSEEKVDDAMIRDICPKLATAQAQNAPINEKRRKHFQRSVLFASLAIIPVAFQAICFLTLKIQGVPNV